MFTVAAHILREDFHKLSMVMKTSMMVIKPKVPWPILLFHRPAQASYQRLCSELSYASSPCTPRASYSQTFAPCVLFHHQTDRSYSHQT